MKLSVYDINRSQGLCKRYYFGKVDLLINGKIFDVINNFDNSNKTKELLNEIKHKIDFYVPKTLDSNFVKMDLIAPILFYSKTFCKDWKNIEHLDIVILNNKDFDELFNNRKWKGVQFEIGKKNHMIYTRNYEGLTSTLFHELTHIFDSSNHDLTEYVNFPYTIRWFEIKAFMLSEMCRIRYYDRILNSFENSLDGHNVYSEMDELIEKIQTNLLMYEEILILKPEDQPKLQKAFKTFNACIDMWNDFSEEP